MSLAPGTTLGTHEIVWLLGAGGMGEVSRARDTKLNRQVAIKVLPDALRVPNIATIYDLAERAPCVNRRNVDAMPDGRRVIGVMTAGALAAGESNVHVVLNWFTELTQRVALQ